MPVQWAPLAPGVLPGSWQDSAPGTGTSNEDDGDEGDLPCNPAELAECTIEIDEQQEEIWCGDPNISFDEVAKQLKRQEQENYDRQSIDENETEGE